MRTRKRQLATKVETTPGTAISLAAADVLVRIEEGATPRWDFERIESNEVQAYSSRRPGLTGRRLVSLDYSYWLRGSSGISVAAAVTPLWESAVLKRNTVKQVTCGAVTAGPFKNGETITGGTSAATGRIFRDRSASPVLYIPLTGTFTSGEVMTGGTSGATATTSSTPSDQGGVFEPTDSDFVGGSDTKHHLTAQLLQDGYQWTARGCLSDLNFEFRNGHPARCRQTLSGAYSSDGDLALYNVSAYPEEAIAPPRFLNVGLQIAGYSPKDIVDMTFSIPTDPQPREDANDTAADGVRFADYLKSPPTIAFDPAMVTAATFDFFTKLKAATTFAVTWKLVGAAGSNWDFFADECQFMEIGAGDRRGVAVAPLRIGCFGNKNNEFAIWQH